jgi:hypothetical protein
MDAARHCSRLGECFAIQWQTPDGCQPGGFEKFFDELSKISATDPAEIKKVMAKYGMDYAGPPLFGAWRQQH